MQIGTMLNHIQKKEQKEKVLLKFGIQLKPMKKKKWTKKYHDPNPRNKSFGARVIVTLNNGKKIIAKLDKADAHPYGARPFERKKLY